MGVGGIHAASYFKKEHLKSTVAVVLAKQHPTYPPIKSTVAVVSYYYILFLFFIN